ncbi:MAG: hypothetical protein A2817_01180 [Candidatus Yanofskybacteria bacterium RIFCSPHIGHO2_01_FULL_39_8b]|uniref:NAD-dependent epimerase/dehydratase domain-containing protein n=1 Tax=Candidatus Yanofskybacteria bacterium RIFCSPHIGHO2_01_FULL_39_8b TaxID=1802659 RepID=A0A1F8EFD3_9BACT|nr:MAG: hypothetical protein A2817_01180 [Candidatus Yanofskybacteria bacterium RIFCSPHIGHO2_01_FULL_39_8b]
MFRKVLVTGAGGFIGSNLVQALIKRGDKVHILTRPGSARWRLADTIKHVKIYPVQTFNERSIFNILKKAKLEVVFHLSHYGGNPNQNDEAMVRKVNIDITSALFNACAKIDSIESIIHSGSSSEYGSKNKPMREDMVLEPNTAYGCAKAWSTLYGQYLAREKNIPITTLRLFSVFGYWEHLPRFMPSVILAGLRGHPPQVSDPKIVRDFIFIDDVIRALIMASEKKPVGEIINIGYGKQMELGKAVDIILKNLKSKMGVKWGIGGRSFDKTNAIWQADISKAKKILGWKPKFTQEEGIIKTIKWFNDNQKLYEKVKSQTTR